MYSKFRPVSPVQAIRFLPERIKLPAQTSLIEDRVKAEPNLEKSIPAFLKRLESYAVPFLYLCSSSRVRTELQAVVELLVYNTTKIRKWGYKNYVHGARANESSRKATINIFVLTTSLKRGISLY